MSGDMVSVKIEDSIGFYTFKGGKELNLMDLNLALEMRQALETLEKDPTVKVVVIQGHGKKAFSGGVDVRKMKDFTPSTGENFIRHLHALMRKVMTLKQPVIASILGPCLGWAMEFIMACDLRIATEDALFGLPEVKVGVPSVIEASLLARVVGLGRAQELILTGDMIDAEEALRIGLVNRIVPRSDLTERIRNMCLRLLGLSPHILSIQKDIMDKWLNLDHDHGAEYSAKAFALCFASSHPREAMEAFLEKREPQYDT